ncbi:MAG TPA: MarR family transcriptional regulator [Flexivirga sp.]|uniref:MarR family winged helix-turn-helix transcriptional regulator n=1 Tax=Flexivirga sp. TaxID=1962927 RepID=UPI002CE8107E|nr:MarR family transcriptional regulator [Flexivirga sp.]HWC21449.1 MarR family transcriptional regulator [Flexivirga sp.]
MNSRSQLVRQLQQIFVLLDDGDRRALRRIGLTPTQYALLRAVDESPLRELTVSRLADVLLCTRGNAARLVRRLQDGGLTSTREDADDQRLRIVTLTAEGRSRLKAAAAALRTADDRRLDALSAKDLRVLSELTERLAGELGRDLAERTD